MFAQPAWLALLGALPLLGLALFAFDRREERSWKRFVAPDLRPRLVKLAGRSGLWTTRGLILAGLALLSLALARPQWGSRTEERAVEGRQVLIAMDISRSMSTRDLPPSRLDFAKVSALELIDALPEDRIGLAAFAADAFILTPLTIDHPAVKESTLALDPSLAARQGTSLNRLLEEAARSFRRSAAESKLLVVFSDGEAHSKLEKELLASLKSQGVRCICFGLGTEAGGVIPGPDGSPFTDDEGRIVRSRYQSASLVELAAALDGRHQQLTPGASPVATVTAALSGIESAPGTSRFREVPVERFQWFLLPALLLLALACLSGMRHPAASTAALAILCLGLGSGDSLAHTPGRSEAADAFRQGVALAQQDAAAAMNCFAITLLSPEPEHRQLARVNIANLQLRRCAKRIMAGPAAGEAAFDAGQILAEIDEAEAHLNAAQALPDTKARIAQSIAANLDYAQALRRALQKHARSTPPSRPPSPAPDPDPSPDQSGNDTSDEPSGQARRGGQEGDADNNRGKRPSESEGGPSENSGEGTHGDDAEPTDLSRLPGETPEQRARRILRANSELRGPTRRRKLPFSFEPEKNW